ncbi:hypothetical protein D1BOALGB6SA_4854 [Olavius sp. associated proteobacterium Delta 1]|nr:hypothetical protein D1BOALGB6SA_4854 [Olavius sp. associated proteobacterium Delta 1]
MTPFNFPSNNPLRLCIIHPYPTARCETFILQHIEGLPAYLRVLYGGHMPHYDTDGHIPLLGRLMHLVFNSLLSHNREYLPEPIGLGRLIARIRTTALARYFRKHRIQTVLAEFGPTGVAVLNACIMAGASLVVHFHGYDVSIDRVLKKYRGGYDRIFKHADAFIGVSREMCDKLIDFGAPVAKVHYNVYGVDIDQFQPAHAGKVPPIFAAVGRFVEKKAPELTLQAFSQTLSQVPDARLIMAGDGHLLETCKRLASKLGLEKVVTFPGTLNPKEVAAVLRDSRAFVQHSRRAINGDCEGTPNSILEACATGLAVVSTKHAGIPDVIIEGMTGFLVAEGDVAAMADKMVLLGRNPALAESMGRKARQHMVSHFSLEKSINSLWNIICQADASKTAQIKWGM